MKTWHSGDEVETEGEIEIHFGGSFFVGTITDHKENAISKIGKKILMACHDHTEISKHFNLPVVTKEIPKPSKIKTPQVPL